MDKQVLEASIREFKYEIDPDLAHLDLHEFIDAVALTPGEKKLAKKMLLELSTYDN